MGFQPGQTGQALKGGVCAAAAVGIGLAAHRPGEEAVL